MHVLAALHGAEASVVAQDGLRKQRTAFVRAVLSGGLTLATPGAVPSLLEGLLGVTLAVMWSGSCVDIWPRISDVHESYYQRTSWSCFCWYTS